MNTETFKKVIGDHLEQRAVNDELFAQTMQKPNKNLGDCVKYIIGQVKKTGENVFADDEIFNMAVHYYDDEIFNMAVHYYDEDDINVGPATSGTVSVTQGPTIRPVEFKPKKEPKKKESDILSEVQMPLF